MFVFSFLPSIVRIMSLCLWTEYKGLNVWNRSSARIIMQRMCLTMSRVNTMGLISLSCCLSFHFKWLCRPLSPSDQQKVDDSRSECNYFLRAAAAKSQFVSSFLCLFYIWASAQTHTPKAHKASIFIFLFLLLEKREGNMHFSCSAGFAWINTTVRCNFLWTWTEEALHADVHIYLQSERSLSF